MGIREMLRRTVSELVNGNVCDIQSASKDCRASNHLAVASAVTQIGGHAIRSHKLKDYAPPLDRRDNIGGLLTDIGKFFVYSAANLPVNDVSVTDVVARTF